MGPLNFKQWIEDHRHLLKPPVGNKMIWEDGEFICMVVGGPNTRSDYHYNEGPEFFYQVEGDIVLKVVEDNGDFKDIEIKEGEVFLLPGKMLHSPQRPAGSVGLVIERKRTAEEQDGFLWFCEKCQHKYHSEFFNLENIETQLPPIFERYWESNENRTCDKCGHLHVKN